jgi:hypothetical protein
MAGGTSDGTLELAQREIQRRLLRQEKLRRIEAEERRRLREMGWRARERGGPVEGGGTAPAAGNGSIHAAAEAIETMEQEKRALAEEARRRTMARELSAEYRADQHHVRRRLEDAQALKKKLDDVEAEMNDMIGDARFYDLNYTADAMKHYLGRCGSFFPFPSADLHRFDTVAASEAEMRDYFRKWMVEPKVRRRTVYVDGLPKTETVTNPLARISEDLLAIRDEESMQRNTYWTSLFEYPSTLQQVGGAALGAAGLATPEADLAGSAGAAQLRGAGDFAFKRDGDEIGFEGLVDYIYDDRYDFEPDTRFRKPSFWANVWGERFSGDNGRLMALHDRAKEFNMGTRWAQRVKGKLGVTPDGRIELIDDPVWIDAEPYDKWRP